MTSLVFSETLPVFLKNAKIYPKYLLLFKVLIGAIINSGYSKFTQNLICFFLYLVPLDFPCFFTKISIEAWVINSFTNNSSRYTIFLSKIIFLHSFFIQKL